MLQFFNLFDTFMLRMLQWIGKFQWVKSTGWVTRIKIITKVTKGNCWNYFQARQRAKLQQKILKTKFQHFYKIEKFYHFN